jgi:tetratricopeptide (TPR) repeat protein
MTRRAICGLALLLALAMIGRGEEKPLGQRMLQGDDATKAAELTKQINQLLLVGRFAEAVKPAEALLALREGKQGKDHWETVDARQVLDLAKQVAKEPESVQKALAESRRQQLEADRLEAQGKYREAEPIRMEVLSQSRKILGEAHPETAQQFNRLGGVQYVLGKLKEAEESIRKALEIRLKALPAGHPDIAQSYHNLAAVQWNLGKLNEGEESLRKALEVVLKALPPGHPHIAQSYEGLGVVQQELGKLKEAEESHRKALEMRLKALPPGHPDIAQSYNNLGAVQQKLGKLKEAEESLRKALEIFLKALPAGHPHIAAGYNNLGMVQQELGKLKEAEESHRKALEMRLKALPPGHPDIATGYNNLGMVQQELGKLKEAEESHRKALEMRLKALPAGHPHIAASYSNLGVVQQELGKLKEAEESLRKALEILLKALPPGHPDIAGCYNNLGEVQRNLGKLKEAEENYRKALEIFLKTLPPGHPHIATSYNNLGSVQGDQGKLKEAEESLRNALEIRLKALPLGHSDLAMSYNNLGVVQGKLGKLKEAEESLRNALEINLRTLPSGRSEIAFSYNSLGVVQHHLGKLKEAEESLRKALEIRLKALPAGHPSTATSYNNLGLVQQELGKLKEAEESLRKALEILLKALPPGHPNIAGCYNTLGAVQLELGKLKEAEESASKALEIFLKALPAGHPDIAGCYNTLGGVQWKLGKLKEAEESCRKALEIWLMALPAGHPDIAASYINLGGLLRQLGKLKEAEKLLRSAGQSFELMRIRVGPGSSERVHLARTRSPYGLWSACLVRLEKPEEAWQAAEANRARGLLDDLAARNAEHGSSLRERRARLEQLDRLIRPLILASELKTEEQARLKELRRQRDELLDGMSREAAEQSRREVYSLASIQKQIPPDAALLLWIDLRDDPSASDPRGDHWACIVRSSGPPHWVQLDGTGDRGAWTDSDRLLAFNLRDLLAHGSPDWNDLARRLYDQRLKPLEPHLGTAGDLPAVRHLVVIPTGLMAGVPVELLTERYRVSYAPSGTLFARLHEQHRPLSGESLLALGDPAFSPAKSEPPPLPPYGLLLTLVLPGGAAQAARLRGGDVLLSYNGVKLNALADLKLVAEGQQIPAQAWRDGQVLDLTLKPGKLGVAIANDPAPTALRKEREAVALAERSRGESFKPLPATRREVQQIAGLFPGKSTVTLLGSDASEQRLDVLAGESGGLKRFRVLHLATHGVADDISAEHSFLAVASDKLPDATAQLLAGKKVYNGRLTVEEIGTRWELDADLVTLSACQTAVGPDGGGEGLLGFSQVLFRKGARSLVLSLWKVDDTATALLMVRFYENLLGKREGLKAPLPRAEALREAKRWLRELPRKDAESLAAALDKGELRGSVSPLKPLAEPPKEAVGQKGDRPFAHPYYWAAFILLGDPD